MNFYLKKYGFLPAQVKSPPKKDLRTIVVIPCFNEPDLVSTLKSLAKNQPTKHSVEVIVVLNSGELAEQSILNQNEITKEQFDEFVNQQQSEFIEFHCIDIKNLPKKHAGVGLARKIGMDEAVARFDELNRDGVIVCFDADAIVESNYLKTIENHFIENHLTPGASIHFEHPIKGNDFSNEIYEGIINYELHLRYYNQCFRYSNLPYAYHTVGSSMAVRSSAYQKQGGMNKRKAGEDFYFIHKIIALGNFTEIKSTMVIPSPRVSDRVPFGTGKAIGDWIKDGSNEYLTYNFEIFKDIKLFTNQLEKFYDLESDISLLSKAFQDFLKQEDFTAKINEIKENTRDYAAFQKRFFNWFDAFKVLKLVHFMRDNQHQNNEILKAVNQMLSAYHEVADIDTKVEQLTFLRKLESTT